MKLRNIFFIAAVFSFLVGNSQENLSLSDAISIALENNYDLKVQRGNEEIAGINNTWGNTNLVPTLNFNTTARKTWYNSDSGDFSQGLVSPDLSLNWVIFDGFTAKINKQTFEDLEEQSKGNTSILVENTIQDIILAYNNCLLQKEMVDVLEELNELSLDRYQRALDSKEIGATTTYETLQAKTSWLEDQSNYLQQKVTFQNAVRTLNFALGVPNEAQWTFTGSLSTTAPNYDVEVLQEKMGENNKTLQNQYVYQSLLAKETALAKSSYAPTISLNAGLAATEMNQEFTNPDPTFNQNNTNSYIGVTFTWNIFNGGKRSRSVQIAKIQEDIANVQTEQMEQSLDNQLLQLFNSYEVQKSVYELSLEQEKAAKLNLDLSKEKLANGNINSFNYRDVQIAYMNAALQKLNTTYNLIKSNTDLLRITGGIINEYN